MQKHKTDITTRRLALLIDCDNISANCAEEIFDKAKQHGQITIKRAYGDWNSAYTKGWVEMCRKFALRPVHQFGVPGKNSTDMALIIDAMDILYMYAHHNVDAVCICSSDRDYVPLVIRIKESGLFVIGFLIKEISSKETVNAYDEVIYISNQKAKSGSSDIHKIIDEKTKDEIIYISNQKAKSGSSDIHKIIDEKTKDEIIYISNQKAKSGSSDIHKIIDEKTKDEIIYISNQKAKPGSSDIHKIIDEKTKDEIVYISNQKAKLGSSDIHKIIDEKTKKVLKEVYKESLSSEESDNPEGVPLSRLGSKLKSKGIDYKDYRFKQLNEFLIDSQLFKIERAGTQMRAVLK